MNYDSFLSAIKETAMFFKERFSGKRISIVSHLDADGISACAILMRALEHLNCEFVVSIVQQLTCSKIEALISEDFDAYIFADLGSGHLQQLNSKAKQKAVFILDHHKPSSQQNLRSDAKNIKHINPHLFRIAEDDISGAGVAYLFALALDSQNKKLAWLAIVGALGDLQDKTGFGFLNRMILEHAQESGNLKVEQGLKLFGIQSRPLHKVLEYSTEIYIPGVTGSESGAIQFLQQLGINPKQGKEWKKLIHLSDDELKKLAAGIIVKRFGEALPEDVFGDIYILPHEEKGSPFYDAKEFATLLNACGRMKSASVGLGACLGYKHEKDKAVKILSAYKKEIVKALKWFYDEGKKSSLQGENFIIINAGKAVQSTMIGTLASMLSKNKEFPPGTCIVAMAQDNDGNTKVSMRIAGERSQLISSCADDLNCIIKQLAKKYGNEAGGHRFAAGCFIPSCKEEEFIADVIDFFEKKNIKIQ